MKLRRTFSLVALLVCLLCQNVLAQTGIEAWFNQAIKDIENATMQVENTYGAINSQIEAATLQFVNDINRFSSGLLNSTRNFNCNASTQQALKEGLDAMIPNGSFAEAGVAGKYAGAAAEKCAECFQVALSKMACRIPETIQGSLAFMDKMQSAVNDPRLQNIDASLRPIAAIMMNTVTGFSDEFFFYIEAAENIESIGGNVGLSIDPTRLYSATACAAYGDEAFDAMIGRLQDIVDKETAKEKVKRRYKVLAKILTGHDRLAQVADINSKIDQLAAMMPTSLESKVPEANKLFTIGNGENVFVNATGNGLWVDYRNWSQQQVPLPYQTAYIPAGKTAIIDRAISVKDVIGLVGTNSSMPYDGVAFYIQSVGSGGVLDISGYSKDNGGNLHQWEFTGADNQKFIFKDAGDGTYFIQGVQSRKYLDIEGSSTNSGANIHQWQFNGNNNQRWIVEQVGDGTVYLKSKHSSIHLTVNEDGNITQTNWNGGEAQRFILVSSAVDDKDQINFTNTSAYYHGHTFNIQIKNSGHYFAVLNNSKEPGGDIVQADNPAHGTHKFIFEDTGDGDGSYFIRNEWSDLYLDVFGPSTDNGANLGQWSRSGWENQKFLLEEAGNGYYYLKSKHSGKVIGINGDSHALGASAIQWEQNKVAGSQMFKLIPASPAGKTFFIKPKHSSKVLDVEGPSNQAGNRVHLWDQHGGANQQFVFQFAEMEGTTAWYYIRSKNTGMYIDVQGFVKENGGVIAQTDDVGYNDWNKMFRLEKYNDEYYYIQGRFSRRYLDLSGCSADNGTKLQIYDKVPDAGCQLFKLIETN
ncbi:RICIN domain-containing protein [Roseivirga sp. E12]|uniref:RICIN domain-containing protein n=1 Tax=Roseivirga sp. E12 TaxID=2819237 RepID=UPI001ABCEB2D|nr:RICIN domain-containing protein [Roseivirga sp. E12]MBO3697337.1 RICIN domain-containing protein [Roseivirga sp. E12]